MKQKRDAQGRFVKTKPSYEELKATVNLLAEDVYYWKDKYDEEKKRFELSEEIGTRRGAAIAWLLDRVPFWTRNKFIEKFGAL